MTEAARDRLRKLIVTGDNRLKQGDGRLAERARESYLEALAVAEQAGLADDRLRALIARRLDDIDASRVDTAGTP
jgi:hypothetical protein